MLFLEINLLKSLFITSHLDGVLTHFDIVYLFIYTIIFYFLYELNVFSITFPIINNAVSFF